MSEHEHVLARLVARTANDIDDDTLLYVADEVERLADDLAGALEAMREMEGELIGLRAMAELRHEVPVTTKPPIFTEPWTPPTGPMTAKGEPWPPAGEVEA